MKKLWGFLFLGFVCLLSLAGCGSIRSQVDTEVTGEMKQQTYEMGEADKLTVKNIYIKDSFVKVNVKGAVTKRITITAPESVFEEIKVTTMLNRIYIEANKTHRYLTDSITVDIEGYKFVDISTSACEITTQANTIVDGFSGSFSSVSYATIDATNMTRLSNISGSGVSTIYLNNASELSDVDVDLSGCSHFYADNMSAEKLDMSLSGASSSNINGKYTKVKLNISGASQLEMSGSTSELELEISGASKYLAQELSASTANAYVSGASEVTLSCGEALYYNVSGASALSYKGACKIDKNSSISGSSIVKTL